MIVFNSVVYSCESKSHVNSENQLSDVLQQISTNLFISLFQLLFFKLHKEM